MPDYVLGVDAGNTKTIALIATTDGQIVGAGRAGVGDIYATKTPDVAVNATFTATKEALDQAGLDNSDLAFAAFSMAGADWPEDFALIEATMAEHGLGRRRHVVNDAIGALASGSPDGTGVVVACGTGIATGAANANGKIWHSSHWQEPNGAGHFGRLVVRAVLRAELQIDPPTALTAAVRDHFGGITVEEILHRFSAREKFWPTSEVAKLARVLLDVAAQRDPTAIAIVDTQGQRMADYAIAAARLVDLLDQPFTLVLSGGVFRHPDHRLAESVSSPVRAINPAVQTIRSSLEPAAGAVLLALRDLGITTDATVRQRVQATLPDHDFFAT